MIYLLKENKRCYLMRKLVLISTVILIFIVAGCSKKPEEVEIVKEKGAYVMTESRTVKTKSTRDLTDLFSDINYSMKRWNEGYHEIPRVYLMDISSRWGDQSKKITTKVKKAIFFKSILPLILRSNELILIDREKLQAIFSRFPKIEASEQVWLQQMAKRYRLSKTEHQPVDRQKFEKLLLRVNIIPPSLALAQAAEESGWGASRFAMMGNALFGQWDFSGKGMAPSRQRKELGNYGLARFDTLLDAVKGYMLNLNTHGAYKKLRLKRAELEQRGEKITGYLLADTLDKYSERGYAYVQSLHHMMNYNKLNVVDEAYLWDRETIFVVPHPDPKPKPKPVVIVEKMTTVNADINESNQTVMEGNVTLPIVDINSTAMVENNLTVLSLESNQSKIEETNSTSK